MISRYFTIATAFPPPLKHLSRPCTDKKPFRLARPPRCSPAGLAAGRLILTLLTAFWWPSQAPAEVQVIGELARTSAIKPGGSFGGVILLKNSGRQPAEVRVLQTDNLSYVEGTGYSGEPGQSPRSNARWITISPASLKLAPGETQSVRYKGQAPADQRLRGTFSSIIMVEPRSAQTVAPTAKRGQIPGGLLTGARFPIQIITEVGRHATRSLQVLGVRVVRDEGRLALLLDIGNDGEQMLKPGMSVEFFERTGTSIGQFSTELAQIFPACSARRIVGLAEMPVGKYAAIVLLDVGNAEKQGVQYQFEIIP